VDQQTADSACTATAYLCGVKNNFGTIGVNSKISRKNCEGMKNPEYFTTSILKWAQDFGKSTGEDYFVTSPILLSVGILM
jgi:Alkaline phosphatase